MCQQLTAAVNNPAKTFRYEAPQIEDILVSGDLAVVRLIWTLSITDPNVPGGLTIKERGIDVFTRQKDGIWKISISHAYPDPPTEQ
jgi:ketosteroid isomerase-like protein